jgi:hypothetical protein
MSIFGMFGAFLGTSLTQHHMGRTRYAAGWKGVGKSRYAPHQGEREIARRLRQAQRVEERRAERLADARHRFGGHGLSIVKMATGITRRGNYVFSGQGASERK